MNHPRITQELSFKCGICSLPLSVPPIYHNFSFGSICGRCEELTVELNKDVPFERQILYEEIAKHLVFPCSYEKYGCKAEVSWLTVSNHEMTCSFKVTNVLCPLSHEKYQEWCSWIGDHTELCKHIQDSHKNYFPVPLEITLTREFKSNILFSELDQNIVMIILDYKENVQSYHCYVLSNMHFNECQNYSYEIHIHGRNLDKPIIFKGEKLEYLSSIITVANYGTSVVVPISSFVSLFQRYFEVTVKFFIIRKDETANDSSGSFANLYGESLLPEMFLNAPSETAVLDMRVMYELECPVCAELMAPPIYICETGHNVCNRCKRKIHECPMCRSRMLGGRNFTLEKLSAIVSGPCVNRLNGCSYIAPISKVKVHEQNCFLAKRYCILNKCKWYGMMLEMPEHLEEEHAFLEPNSIYTYELRKKSDQFMLLYDDKIFIFSVSFEHNKPLKYSLNCFGGEILEYQYELEIIEPFTEYNELCIQDNCQPLSYNFEKGSFSILTIPFSMVRQLVKSYGQLNFRIDIKRIND